MCRGIVIHFEEPVTFHLRSRGNRLLLGGQVAVRGRGMKPSLHASVLRVPGRVPAMRNMSRRYLRSFWRRV